MTQNEFQTLLAKGLGRVILFLQENDDAPYRDLIVYASTHNMAFDRQTESRCADYYFDLISASQNPIYYRDHLLAALISPPLDSYSYQILAILSLFAASGDKEARTALYAEFARSDNGDLDGADLLICLDGYAGLQFVAEHRPLLDAEEDDWLLTDCIEILEKRYGVEEAWRVLERMAAESSAVAAWLTIVRKRRAQWEETRKRLRSQRPTLSYAELKALIGSKGRKLYGKAWFWHRTASAEELLQAAHDLLTEKDPDRLVAYLQIFSRCGFPLDPSPIIALADSEDSDLSRTALFALEHTTHPRVRAFVLDCLATSQRMQWIVGLLAANFEPGDSATIVELTTQTLDPDGYHHLQRRAEDFVKAHWDEQSVPILLNLYENGPCSLCRYTSVKMLLEHEALPMWLRNEARYDADEDTRALVK